MAQKIDLFGTGLQAISDTITTQRRVNIFYDPRPDGENNPIVIMQTPGTKLFVQLPTVGGRSMWQNGQYAFEVCGNELFLLQNSGYTLLGSFGSATLPNIFEMRTNLTELVMADGTSIWTFNIENLASLITQGGQIVNGLSSLQTLVNSMWG